jgi:hypothetical protein
MSNATLDFFNSLLPDTLSLANIKDDRPNADPDYGIGPDSPLFLNSGPSYFDSRITNSTGGTLPINLNSPEGPTTGTLAQQLAPEFSYNSWCGDVNLPIPLRPQTGDPTNSNFSYIDANGNNNWDIGNPNGDAVDDIRVYNNVAVVSSYLSNAASTYDSIFHSSPDFIPDTSPAFIPGTDTPFFADRGTDGYADPLQRINWLFNFVIEPQQVIAAGTALPGTSGDTLTYATYFVDLNGATGGYTPADTNGNSVIDTNDFFSLGDVQLAIWKLLGQPASSANTNEAFAAGITSDARAETLFDLAWDNGSSFVPGARQDAVVILSPTYTNAGVVTRYQPILIEVEVPSPPTTPIPTTFAVTGYKWLDADTQGDWDGGETGLKGWTIYLEDDGDAISGNDTTLVTAETDSNGLYRLSLGTFTGATTKTFYIYENNIPGWTNSYNGATRLDVTTSVDVPTGNISISQVVVNGGTPITDPALIPLALNGAINNAESLNFGNYFTISGSKYIDANGNGLIAEDGDVKSTTAFTINLYSWGDVNDDGQVQNIELSTTPLQTTQTVNGDFSFTGLGFLGEGFKYYVQEVVPSGWTQTVGNSGYVVDPTTGANASGNIFANFKEPEEIPGFGKTPGFWRQSQHFQYWPTGCSPSSTFSGTFGVGSTSSGGKFRYNNTNYFTDSLLGGVTATGGGVNALGRAATAGLLNAKSDELNSNVKGDSINYVIDQTKLAQLAGTNFSAVIDTLNKVDLDGDKVIGSSEVILAVRDVFGVETSGKNFFSFTNTSINSLATALDYMNNMGNV